MSTCHVCRTCGGKGYLWDRTIRANRPCPRCMGTGSDLSR